MEVASSNWTINRKSIIKIGTTNEKKQFEDQNVTIIENGEQHYNFIQYLS